MSGREAPLLSRTMLARLRALMGADTALAARLAGVVRLVSAELVAEVCSVYVARPGEILELAATEGLRPEAVGRTRLRLGEGLVGSAAAEGRVLNVPDAQLHPAFVYRPETGEERFASMLAVPILRGTEVLGVIAVQNRLPRRYSEDEVEAVETVAMLLAEVLHGARRADEEVGRSLAATLSRHYEGVGLTPGLALGPVHRHGRVAVAAPVLADDPQAERKRLAEALEAMRRELDALIAAPGFGASGEPAEVLDAYRMIATDAGWIARIEEAITGGLAAEAAVERVLADLRARFRGFADPLLRERLADIEDLAGRLLDALAGPADRPAPPPDFVLIARRIGPADLLDYRRHGVAGLVIEEASPTAHATIIARALGIPLLAGCRGVWEAAQPGETALVDADRGRLVLRPDAELVSAYRARQAARAARVAEMASLRLLPPLTRDGVRLSVMLNVGLLADLADLDACGADGIGLFRSEIEWLARGGLPDPATEEAIYREVVAAAGERPVLFRTLDLGGDKLMPGFGHDEEENPALGWRSIRIGLDRPALLRRQLRALVAAAAGRTLAVLFPLITTVEEFRAARDLLAAEERAARRRGAAPTRVLAGAMLEVPALFFQLPALLAEVDFLSVGSNDLTQFLFAADRGNRRVGARYDFLSAPVLDLLEEVAREADAAGVPVSLCGEAAGRPLEALAVFGVGIRTVSVAAAAVPAVKAMVRSLDLGAFREVLAGLRRSARGGASLRAEIAAYARDRGIVVD
ncbi:MAG: GAF domain-containing protein [Elioraea sp.]|nr:GAF domain-containing protein [Elioraea sp.]